MLLRAACIFSVMAGLLSAPGPAFAGPSRSVLGVGGAGPVTESVAASQAAQNKADVVVDSLTTPTEQTVAHPDGSFTRTVNAEPVRMQTATGWQDISTDLVQATVNGQPVLKPKMTPVDVSLARGGSAEMAKVDDKRGHTVKQSWPFGALPEPTVSGNTATYPSVLPGVDLIQVSHKTGVSQVLKIATAEAAKDPRVVQMRIFLDAQNVTVQAETGGGLSATGADTGKAELRTAMGQWWDSSQSGASASDPGGPGITRPFSLSLGSENGKQTQVLGMSEILNLPNLHYPLFVDPDWSTVRASYLYVDSAYPGTSYWNGQYTDSTVHVGYLPAAWAPDRVPHTTRGYYQFDTTPMSGKIILAAVMNATETWSSSCTATPVDAWVTGGISPGTTWYAQPGLVAKVDSQTVAKGYSDYSCPAGKVGFDLSSIKSTLQTVGQWTVSLWAGNEGDPLGWKRFNNDASIIVTYDTPPYTPGLWTINNARWTGAPFASTYVTRSNQPTYTLTVGDPDGAPGGNINTWMSLFKGNTYIGGTGPLSELGSGGYPSWPGPQLADGVYQLQAQSQDSNGVNSGVMQFFFEVRTTQPDPPTITSVGPAPAYDPALSPFDPTHNDQNGTVGSTNYNFNIDEPGTYPVQGFVYAVSDTAAPTSPPTNLSCGTRTLQFVVVCPADGRHGTVTVAAIDSTSILTVWSFDYAGNVNNQTASKLAVTYQYAVANKAALPSTFLDVPNTTGATWTDIQTANGPTGSCQDAPYTGPGTAKALEITDATKHAETAASDGSAVNTADSFSVSGWFCPVSLAAPPGISLQALITQMAGTNSPGAALQLDASNKPELDTWLNTTTSEQVKLSRPLGTSWYFLAAVYDKTNQQLRITKTQNGTTSTWTTATTTTNHLASTSTQPVRLGGGFIGRIFKPMMTQGVLTADQFANAQNTYANTDTGVLK